MNFTVYPKEGETFRLRMSNFSFDGSSFTLYDASGSPSAVGFISPDNAAAIIPEILDTYKSAIHFNVYLKRRKDPDAEMKQGASVTYAQASLFE